MHLSKKKKLITAWAVPAALVVSASIVVPSVVISMEKNQYKTLNEAKNIEPKTFLDFDQKQLNDLTYNPEKFDVNFFYFKICQSNFKNTIFDFGNSFEKIENENQIVSWKNKESNVMYNIISILSKENKPNLVDGKYQFEVTVRKEISDKFEDYSFTLEIDETKFASSQDSTRNFLALNAAKINQEFEKQNLKVSTSLNSNATDVSQIVSSKDLIINNLNSQYSLHKSNLGDYYNIGSSNQDNLSYYGENNGIKLSISDPIQIWNASEAYKVDDQGNIEPTSPLYSFIKTEYDNKNITLAELNENTEGLSEEQILNKKIQKYIFNSNNVSFYVSNNQILPLATYQAVIIQVEFQNQKTYLVSWSNIFSVSNSILDNASEIGYKILPCDSQLLTYEEIQKPENFSFIVAQTNTQNGLIYKVESVVFDTAKDPYCTEAIINVKISHSDLSSTKTYQTRVTTGFMSKALVELNQTIESIIGSTKDLSKLQPIVSILDGKKLDDFDTSSVEEVAKNINVTNPSALQASAKYELVFTRREDSKLRLGFFILSNNDQNNYWTQGGETVQIDVLI